MISNIYKMSDAEFSVFMENFQTVFEDKQAELGVTAEQVTEVIGIKTGMQTALNEKQAAEELKQAKTAALREKRKRKRIRKWHITTRSSKQAMRFPRA